MADVREWQNRTLEKSYPILFLDALRVNSRQDVKISTKSFMSLWQSTGDWQLISLQYYLTGVFPTLINPCHLHRIYDRDEII